jgi:hypothetical protein
MLTAKQAFQWVTARTTPPWRMSELRSAFEADPRQPYSLRNVIEAIKDQKPGTDCYIASMTAALVSTSLKANKQLVVDADLIRKSITSPSVSSSPIVPSLLTYLQTPACLQVIADASLLAAQVFIILGGTSTTSGRLSTTVSANQIIAAVTASYEVLAITKRMPPFALWKKLRSRNA